MLGKEVTYQCFADFSPGRFFAVTEIKLMLAFTLLRYDFRVKDEKRPADLHITYVTMPNPKAKVLFRKRV